jgi:predicted porin
VTPAGRGCSRPVVPSRARIITQGIAKMTTIRAGLLLLSVAAAGIAQAQNSPTATDDSLTFKGITLYGVVDLGLQYQTHGVPISDYFPAGSEAPIQKNSNGSVTGVTPSNLSQSRIGLAGAEPLGVGDWTGVFRVETFFNPQSGELSDALKSLVQNNGRALTAQSTNVDSSVAGQLFAGAAYAGFSSPTYGTLTFGRHVTPLADGISKYDPMGAAQAFSLIGFSGTTAGGGDTEDRRLDQSLKYSAKYDWLHLGALYQFSQSSGSQNTAVQATVGAEYAGLSVDAYYAKKYDAVSASALSTKQVGELQTDCNATPLVSCYSVSNSLSATISDNTTYAIMGSYNFGGSLPTLFAAYEHINFANPNTGYSPGALTIGGYVLAFVNNTAYDTNKTLEVFWAGLKWPITPSLDLMVAYYGYKQNSYATGANAGCTSTVASQCSGTENSASAVLDYKFTKRFDAYIGTFWSSVNDGLANDYLNDSTITTTMGIRFKF